MIEVNVQPAPVLQIVPQERPAVVVNPVAGNSLVIAEEKNARLVQLFEGPSEVQTLSSREITLELEVPSPPSLSVFRTTSIIGSVSGAPQEADLPDRVAYDSGNRDIVYVGRGDVSSSQIYRYIVSTGIIEYADGDENFDNDWTNRESLAYS